MFPAMPLLKVDPGAIIDGEHLATLGRTLPEFLQRQSLERVPVVLPLACELIGRRQMGERMGPQVERIAMARGILNVIVRRRRVMRGGGVKVPVARRGLKPIQLRHPGPELRLQRRQTAGQAVGALGDQSPSPLTLEGLKEVGGRRSLQAIRQQMLEKAPGRPVPTGLGRAARAPEQRNARQSSRWG